VAESLLEQVAQLPWEATVGGLSAPGWAVAELPPVPATLRSGRFWVGC